MTRSTSSVPSSNLRSSQNTWRGTLRRNWKNVDSHWVDPLKFISHTGLRKAELINLRWENLDLTKGAEQMTIESCDDWETKTGKSRVIPLLGEALEIVERQRGKNPTYVFTSPEGKMVHPDRIYHALKQCLAELHLEGDVHKMRHTFASNLAMSGVPLLQIRDLLGHTDLKTTQIYAHVAPKHLRDVLRCRATCNRRGWVESRFPPHFAAHPQSERDSSQMFELDH